MDVDRDFFGELFDDSEGDPLLNEENEGSAREKQSSKNGNYQGPPSWMSHQTSSNGRASSDENKKDGGVERKEIIIDQNGEDGDGIDALNQAIRQDWNLVRIYLTQSNKRPEAAAQSTFRFVARLEKQNPQSLFDFG